MNNTYQAGELTEQLFIEDNCLTPEETYLNSSIFFDKTDLIFIKELKAYGAFKYDVVKDILTNNEAIGVSDVHLDLNGVYFSLDEKKHQHNKRAAFNHLSFLSKKLQSSANDFTRELFSYLISKLPEQTPFNLVDYLVNPLILINIFEEYGFLEFLPQFNPKSSSFSHDAAIQKIRDIFHNGDELEKILIAYMANSGIVPERMKLVIDDININNEVDLKLLPRFFASMIFAATHSSSSFLCSLTYTVFTKYPHLLNERKNSEEFHAIADEVLRIYTPVPYIYRTVRKDTTYGDKNLKVGDTVILFIGAANLDPKYFVDPYSMKQNRIEKHLSFGKGQYACIGQFASFRLAVNFLSYMSEYKDEITFLEKNAKHVVHNGMLKLPLNIIFNKRNN